MRQRIQDGWGKGGLINYLTGLKVQNIVQTEILTKAFEDMGNLVSGSKKTKQMEKTS